MTGHASKRQRKKRSSARVWPDRPSDKIIRETYKASDRSIRFCCVASFNLILARFDTFAEAQALTTFNFDFRFSLIAESEPSNDSTYSQSFNCSPRPTASSAKSRLASRAIDKNWRSSNSPLRIMFSYALRKMEMNRNLSSCRESESVNSSNATELDQDTAALGKIIGGSGVHDTSSSLHHHSHSTQTVKRRK